MGVETLTAWPPRVNVSLQRSRTMTDDRESDTKPPAQEPRDHYFEDPGVAIRGNAVHLLRNGGQAFPVWLAAIEAARSTVSLEMYIFEDDSIGFRFADALGRAAQRGVTVRVLY